MSRGYGHPLLATDEDLIEILGVDTGQLARWKQRKGFDPVGDYSARGTKRPLYALAEAKKQLARDKAKEENIG